MKQEEIGWILVIVAVLGISFYMGLFNVTQIQAGVTDIGNWRAEGVHFVPYAKVIEDTVSDRCDRLNGIFSGGFPRKGTIVYIQCDDQNCQNDPDVKLWNQYGYDQSKSYSRYQRAQYFSRSPIDERRGISVIFQNEVDFTGFGDKGFTGKVYFIGFADGESESIGDFSCQFTNHVEFITETPITTTTVIGGTSTIPVTTTTTPFDGDDVLIPGLVALGIIFIGGIGYIFYRR